MGEWIAAAPQLEEDVALGNIALDLLGQARALLTYAGRARGRRARRGRPGLPPRRARVPQRAALRARQRRLRLHDGAAAGRSRPTSTSCTTRLQHAADDDARRGRRQGGQGGRLPPRPRHPVGAAAGRRHRRVAPADAGAASTRSGRTPPSCSRPTTSSRRLVAEACRRRPGRRCEAAAVGLRRRRARTKRRSTLPQASPSARGGRRGIHTEQMGYLLAEMQHLARSHPGATW